MDKVSLNTMYPRNLEMQLFTTDGKLQFIATFGNFCQHMVIFGVIIVILITITTLQ